MISTFINWKELSKIQKRLGWLINEVLKRKVKAETHTSIFHENKEMTNSKEIAETMSEFYKSAAVNKIKQLNSKMNFERFLNPKEKRKDTFKLKEITIANTWLIIRSIAPKKSSGFDGVPSKLLHDSANYLAAPLNAIINQSFREGKFPTKLKLSKLNPCHKRGPWLQPDSNKLFQ